MSRIPQKVLEKLHKIKLLALDVDGVLTDGGVYIAEDGYEFRRFDIKDGLGLKRIVEKGIIVVIISSGGCQSVIHRAKQLGITDIHLNTKDKLEELVSICVSKKVAISEVCYVGDDLADLQVMESVGIPCAPNDAHSVIKEASILVTANDGGKGAVREICDLLLR